MQICPFHRLRRSVILQFIAESFVLEGASLHFLGWRRTRKVFFRFEVCLWFKGQLAAKFNAGNFIYKLLKFPTTFIIPINIQDWIKLWLRCWESDEGFEEGMEFLGVDLIIFVCF